MSKFTLNDVIEFVVNNSNCEVLSTEYINSKTKMLFKCKCGEAFETKFEYFKQGKRQCNYCSGHRKKAKTCEKCGTSFVPHRKSQLFCSMECRVESRKHRYVTKCHNCGNDMEITKSRLDRSEHFYCSQNCKYEHQKVIMVGQNNPNFKNKSFLSICDNCNKSFEYKDYGKIKSKNTYCSQKCKSEHQRTLLVGENNPNFKAIKCNCAYCGKGMLRTKAYLKERINVFCSTECRYDWQSENFSGENNYNYDSSISKEEREIGRNFEGYAYWRRQVYKRDNYTCQCCGDAKGGNIHAHHLDGYHWCKDKRTDISNGITLCKTCHNNFHTTYGCKNNTRQQFEEFIINKHSINKTTPR